MTPRRALLLAGFKARERLGRNLGSGLSGLLFAARRPGTRSSYPGVRAYGFLRVPDPRLRPLLCRPLYGSEQEGPGFASWLERPRPAVTLIVDFEGAITANGESLPDAWIGGLTESYTS